MLLLSYFLSKKYPKLKSTYGILVFLISFLIGSFTLVSSNQTLNSNHFLHQLNTKNKKCYVSICIKEKLKFSSYTNRYVGSILTLDGKNSYGKIILSIKKDSVSSPLEIGTTLIANGFLSKNKKPNNPNQFDYAFYLENQQIYGQFYTDYATIKITPFTEKTFSYYAGKLRNKIIRNLEKNQFNKTELNVVVALLLGQQQDISPEIIRDYQYAGAVHILSVSGLHVGFILLFITFLLKPLPNTKQNLLFKLIIVLISLWIFGIVAGLAPSVVRSVTMFSFVAIGMFLRRSVNIYHTLLVSVLLILLFQPSFLFDVGFQLSYIALFFIVWLQPLFASIWIPKNKIIAYFWDIITVSFAAQIGTFPLSIYYFHQFPGLFFVTNIIVLPMLSVILAVGIVVIVMATFNFIWIPLLKLLEWSIWFLNKIINYVATFEDFIFKDISFNWYMMICSYLVLFSFIIWAIKPSFNKLIFSFISIFLLQICFFQAKYTNQNQNEFIVFSKKKTTFITERIGDKVTLYGSDSIHKNYKENQVLKSYVVANFCRIELEKKLSNLYYFKDKKIFLMDSAAVYDKEAKPDILILTESPKINLERLFKIAKPQQVVADGSNYKSYVKLWKASCIKEKIPFHDTSEKGFYKL